MVRFFFWLVTLRSELTMVMGWGNTGIQRGVERGICAVLDKVLCKNQVVALMVDDGSFMAHAVLVGK
jgi:hypothetical protein